MDDKKGLNGNQLKSIAIIAMTIDHLTWTLAPGYSREWWVILLHVIGRLTAPIMWYFVAEGYHYTHSVRKYAARLFLLAIVSHFAYNFCFGISFVPFRGSVFNQTGVVWSLAWGLVCLSVAENAAIKDWQKRVVIILVCLITFPSDWSCIATMAIVWIGSNRGNFKKQMTSMMIWTCLYALVYFLFIDKVYALIQLGTCLTIPLLHRYNGKRGSWRGMGRLFYAYYPAHLIVCGLIRIYLWGTDFVTGTAHVTVHSVLPRGVFTRSLRDKPETACAKMSVLCSFCVHCVAESGVAVNSNQLIFNLLKSCNRCLKHMFAYGKMVQGK